MGCQASSSTQATPAQKANRRSRTLLDGTPDTARVFNTTEQNDLWNSEGMRRLKLRPPPAIADLNKEPDSPTYSKASSGISKASTSSSSKGQYRRKPARNESKDSQAPGTCRQLNHSGTNSTLASCDSVGESSDRNSSNSNRSQETSQNTYTSEVDEVDAIFQVAQTSSVVVEKVQRAEESFFGGGLFGGCYHGNSGKSSTQIVAGCEVRPMKKEFVVSVVEC